MTNEELTDAIGGLQAYDEGSTDSGIHDEGLRSRCIKALREMDAKQFNDFACDFILDNYLSAESRKLGYGIEDVAGFLKWLARDMECDLL